MNAIQNSECRHAGRDQVGPRYTSGFQDAFIARQGYYSGVPENARKFLTEAEWDSWYGGKPAATDIIERYSWHGWGSPSR